MLDRLALKRFLLLLFAFFLVLFHMLFQMRSSDEALVANLTFMGFLFFTDVSEIVLFPITSTCHGLLFAADLTEYYQFDIGVREIFHIFQTADYR